MACLYDIFGSLFHIHEVIIYFDLKCFEYLKYVKSIVITIMEDFLSTQKINNIDEIV